MMTFKFITILVLSFYSFSFDKKTIYVSDKKLVVEVAQTEKEHSQGLMNRKNLNPGTGMLFIFNEEQILSFWMKNTLIPLSIGYFNAQKKLIDIQDMQPASPMDLAPPVYTSKKPALYALEVPLGWFKKNNIKLGDQFRIETGPKSK